MTRPLTIWIVSDGKPGHENQSLGLAEAIARKTAATTYPISISGQHGLAARLRTATAASAKLPTPDLILAAGHSTHPTLLWLTRKHRARSVVLMKPSLPMAWFDLCVTPAHDFPDGSRRPNLILTRGAINRVTAGIAEKTGKLILIGGPSKTHSWDGETILANLAQATDRGGWELTDSRRTPAGFLEQARERLPGVTVFSHEITPPAWVPEKLQAAKEVWVTEDSVSMIYESLTSGARVGLLPVPRLKRESRVLRGIDALIADKFLTPFSAWQETQRLPAPPEILHEADRCASLVLGFLGRETAGS